MNRFLPRRTKHLNWKEHCQFLLLGIATVFEGLVMVCSLGFFNVETRAWLLFDVFED